MQESGKNASVCYSTKPVLKLRATNLKHIEIVGYPPLVADLEFEDVKLKVDYIDVSFNPDFVVDIDVNVTIQSP